MLGLTRCVALEGAAHGVTCNAISPGYVNTAMMRSSLGHTIEDAGLNKSVDELMAEIADGYPQKRIIEPEEIGALAAFLCSDQAAGINMEDITVSTGSLW